MMRSLQRFGILFVLFSAIVLSGCPGSRNVQQVDYYFISTNHPHFCCRTTQYSTTDFAGTVSSTTEGKGIVVRLLSDTLRASCTGEAQVKLVIANNSDTDVYIPISRELEGNRITLNPWRFLYIAEKPARLARQIRFGDILERELNDSRVQFTRLRSGKQVELIGVIPKERVCQQPSAIYEGYLTQELDPVSYLSQAPAVRRASAVRKEPIRTSVQLRYDVVYTTLDFLRGLPVKSSVKSNDTTRIELNVTEEPVQFLNAVQRVAESNVIIMNIDTTR